MTASSSNISTEELDTIPVADCIGGEVPKLAVPELRVA